MLGKLLIRVIERYQMAGGGRHFFAVECNFTQTCSEYTKQAIADVGVRRGCQLGWQRIKRCTVSDLPHKLADDYPGEAHVRRS